jgi:hypothetical protein
LQDLPPGRALSFRGGEEIILRGLIDLKGLRGSKFKVEEVSKIGRFA